MTQSETVPGFPCAHGLHVWTLTPGIVVMSGDVVADDALATDSRHSLASATLLFSPSGRISAPIAQPLCKPLGRQ